MKVFSLMAAFAAIFSLIASPALAGSRSGDRVWLSGGDNGAIGSALLAGQEVCVGSKKQHSCMLYNPFTQEIRLQEVSRPIGLNQNVVINRVLAATDTGHLVRVDGRLQPAIQDVRSTNNAAAIWTSGFAQMPAAMVNGLGASLANALINRCDSNYGCGNNFNLNNGQAQAGSVSESNAGAQVGITSTGGGTCGSGGCPSGRGH